MQPLTFVFASSHAFRHSVFNVTKQHKHVCYARQVTLSTNKWKPVNNVLKNVFHVQIVMNVSNVSKAHFGRMVHAESALKTVLNATIAQFAKVVWMVILKMKMESAKSAFNYVKNVLLKRTVSSVMVGIFSIPTLTTVDLVSVHVWSVRAKLSVWLAKPTTFLTKQQGNACSVIKFTLTALTVKLMNFKAISRQSNYGKFIQ